MDQYNKDLLAIREHPNQESLMADTALYNRLIDYNKRDMLPSAEIKAILERTPLPENSRSKVVSDSLRKESEKPIVETKQEPIKRSAGEAILQALLPRTMDRSDNGIEGFNVGSAVAGGLDLASLPPRISSNIQQAPIAIANKFTKDIPIETALKTYLSNVGDIHGKSFQTLKPPEWLPDIVKDAAKTVDPINQGIGEFVTALHRGPIIPGGQIARVLGKFPGVARGLAALPGTINPATTQGLNVLGSAALGTSESVARGEGFDPLGAAIGTGFGALPYVGRAIQSKANQVSNITSVDNMIKSAQDDFLHGTPDEKEAAIKLLEDVKKYGKEKYAELIKSSMVRGADIEMAMPENEAIQKFYMRPVSKTREVYVPPTAEPTLKQTAEKLTAWNDLTTPGPLSQYAKEPILRDVTRVRAADSPLSAEELLVLGNPGRVLNAKSTLLNILLGHAPADIIRPVSRVLPDATSTMVYGTRAGNELITPLQTYFSQDSTRQ